MITQRYQMPRGTERALFHVAGPSDQALNIASGAIRFWYIEEVEAAKDDPRFIPLWAVAGKRQQLVMPCADYQAGESVQVKGGKPFCFAAIEPNTVVFHVW